MIGIYQVYTFKMKLCAPPSSRIAIELQQHTGIGLQGCLMFKFSATRQPPAPSGPGFLHGTGSRHGTGSLWTHDHGTDVGGGGVVAPPPPSPLPTAAPPSSAEAPPSAAALPLATPPLAAMGVRLEEARRQSFLCLMILAWGRPPAQGTLRMSS